jgi:hypothetical protein
MKNSKLFLITFFFFTVNAFLATGSEESYLKEKKMIRVQKMQFNNSTPSIKEINHQFDLNQIPFNNIDIINWTNYSYKPDVKFRIAHSEDEIYLQYKVKEKYIRAYYSKDEGSAPYKDSCIEFFIIPCPDDSIYYNLELNCIGVGTFGGGSERKNRTRFGGEVLEQIRRESTLGNLGFDTKKGNFNWQITIAIPKKLFSLSNIGDLSGKCVSANFYKCGDDLPERHYVSWNRINTDKPNFHTPNFFGTICFD